MDIFWTIVAVVAYGACIVIPVYIIAIVVRLIKNWLVTKRVKAEKNNG